MGTQGSIKRDESGAWYYIVDVAGVGGSRKQIRRRGFRTKKAAQEALTRARADMMGGVFVPSKRLTVAEYLAA